MEMNKKSHFFNLPSSGKQNNLSAPHFGGGVILDVAAVKSFQLAPVVVECRARREPDAITTRHTILITFDQLPRRCNAGKRPVAASVPFSNLKHELKTAE